MYLKTQYLEKGEYIMAFPQELAIVIQKEMEKLDLKQVK